MLLRMPSVLVAGSEGRDDKNKEICMTIKGDLCKLRNLPSHPVQISTEFGIIGHYSFQELDCLQSVSLSFLCRNTTQKEHAEHEIRTRTARRIGTRRDGSTREEKRLFSSRPSLFSFNRHFLRTRLLGIITRLTSREKADCKQAIQERIIETKNEINMP